MSDDHHFRTTVEPSKFREILCLAGTEWSGKLTESEFGECEAKSLVDFILKGNPGRAFYIEAKSGQILASCVVTQHKALYKEAAVSTIGTIPDAASFGVNNITAVRLSYVFVAKEARGKGIMRYLVTKAIEHTEAEILKKELAKSSDKKDSFKSMVQNGKEVDATLVKHYLGKKYVWYLYSAIDSAYAKFGFKSYPLEGYKLVPRFSESKTFELVEKLLSPNVPQGTGKKLRLLDGEKQLDRDLIDQILQGKQLELLTDMNKNVYHSELQGESRSSSSLTNLSSTLSSSRPTSSNELSAVTTKFKETFLGSPGDSHSDTRTERDATTQQRRKSSILSLGCPKFAILPDLQGIDHKFAGTKKTAMKAGTPENSEYAKYYGAILTNELQKKQFYVLWMMLKGSQFTIIAMGEMRFDLFAAMANPRGDTTSVQGRRSSSFTGINDMGGFNFQDLDLLVTTAVHVAQKQALNPEGGSLFVNVNDLPTGIPRPVLHDFFLNYLPKAFEKNHKEQAEAGEDLVEFVNFSEYSTLPMLRKYGGERADFELDWVANSLITWG